MASSTPKPIIDGLDLFVDGMELKTLLNKRVNYHKERAKFFEDEVARQKGEVERLIPMQTEFERAAEEQNKGVSYGNRTYQAHPIEGARAALAAAENSQRHHKSKAVYFTFFAEHLDLDAKYKLDESDLHKLEVL